MPTSFLAKPKEEESPIFCWKERRHKVKVRILLLLLLLF
jgi:hypothetical protein